MSGNRVCFLIGSAALSGGSYVIFQHASYLVDQGYTVTLAVQDSFTDATTAWHDHSKKFRLLPIAEARDESFDLVIATWWKTALELATFNAPRYAYFVQSIESRFYSEADKPLRALVDSTYGFPCFYVTEATWITEYLENEHQQNAALVRNGIRKDLYTPKGLVAESRPVKKPRVLVEGHFGVPFKNTALALKLARAAGADDIWVLTGSPVQSLPGVSRVFSRVPIHKTPEIYRSCDILIKLSTVEGMFGPPLEMFHCGGTAVVFDVTGHDEYIRDSENACVVRDRNTSTVVSELRSLLSDTKRLEALKVNALKTADLWPDWQQSSSEFRIWIDGCLASVESDREAVAKLVTDAWEQYAVDEQERLRNDRTIFWRYKLKGMAQRLPRPLQDKIKRILALIEVSVPSRRVF